MKDYLHLFTPVEEGLPENDFGKVYLIMVGGDEIPSYFDKDNKVFVNLAMSRNLNATHWLDLSKLTTKERVIEQILSAECLMPIESFGLTKQEFGKSLIHTLIEEIKQKL